jgi:hypothetical protein
MGGIFGVVSKTDCVLDVFFGTDYHSRVLPAGSTILRIRHFEPNLNMKSVECLA